MEKVCCEMKAIETEGGFRIEVKGAGAKEMLKAWRRGTCCGDK